MTDARAAVGSLRLRLLIAAMAAVAAALAVAWVGLTLLFERHIERREAAELTAVAEILVAGLTLDARGKPVVENPGLDQRFERLASGRYWQLSAPWGVLASRSLWDQSLPRRDAAPTAGWRTRVAPGPFNQPVVLVERTVRLDKGGPPILVQVAQNEETLTTARREFGRELGLSLALLWLFLTVSAWLQVDLGLRPLARIGEAVDRLRASAAARLDGAYPREIAPLTSAINRLADAREADLDRARTRAADLAHSLKTPLAALAAQTRRAREAGASEAADGLEHAIAAMGAALEAELARSRAAAAGSGPAALSAPQPVIERLIAVVERTEAGERVGFQVEASPDLRVPLAVDDLAEVLGALLENAARYARTLVRVTGAEADGRVRLVIEDDGAGIEAGRAEAALIRGGRLDEAGPGHGLGLAIVADLVRATGGDIRLERSNLGGLRVALDWPAP